MRNQHYYGANNIAKHGNDLKKPVKPSEVTKTLKLRQKNKTFTPPLKINSQNIHSRLHWKTLKLRQKNKMGLLTKFVLTAKAGHFSCTCFNIINCELVSEAIMKR